MSETIRYDGAFYKVEECSICHVCGECTPYEFLESYGFEFVFLCDKCEKGERI